MKKTSAKNKLFIILGLWLVLTAAMFFYFFNILNASNEAIISGIADQQNNLASLTAEKDIYLKGQQDLEQMQTEVYQPGDFFSKDVTLVREIQVLEQWANVLNVQFTLSGLSGTVNGAAKAGVSGNIVSEPYSISLIGPFAKVVDYIQVMENLDFITTVNSISMSSGSGNDVTANIGAQFYIRVK
jgi:hypothetical protein